MMKKTLFFLLSITTLSTLMTISSCKKEKMGDGTQFRATMESCTDRHGKTALNGTSLNWIVGDRIAVYGSEGRGIYSATPLTPATTAIFNNVSGTAGEGMYRAFYPSTLTVDGIHITLPSVQNSADGSLTEFPMYAQSNDDILSFKNLCGALKIHLQKADVSISSIMVTADAEINGDFTLRYTGVPTISYESNGSRATTMQLSSAQSIANGKDFYVYLPHGNYSRMSFTFTTDDGSFCTKSTKQGVSIYITRSQYTQISFGENDLNFVQLPQGALPALFSVGATQQVYFSQGNLQYQASTGTWRFAEHQYDYIGEANQSDNALTTGWIDYFGWGTGNNPTLRENDFSYYQTFVDWGVNAISNGGNQANMWRTLSSAEWDYLFNYRTDASSKYATATVNNVPGVVVLPDVFTMPAGLSFNPGMVCWWESNVYSAQDWLRMETAGAMFLPASGEWLLDGRGVDGVGFDGNYWSSTYDEWGDSYRLCFTDCDMYPTGNWDRHLSLSSVRLVMENN